jgi:hypothetical protein
MAYRFTDTEKWRDLWYSKLTQLQKLLFIYLCDNCDIAGFIDVNYRLWAFDIGSSEETIKGALVGLDRGLVVSNCGETLYIRNFLKHQKNYPLNEKNAAHRGIIKCFNSKGYKFDIQDINEFIEGASKGLTSPIGNSNGIGKSKKENFTIPTILQIKEYCKERNNDVDSNKFFNFYESKGWMVGKNKMKDWKACVRTWEGKEQVKHNPVVNNIRTL